MADRYDVCAPRPKRDGGTFWVKIGSAWPAKSGEGFNITFDALPIPDNEGRVSVSLFKAKPRQEGGRGGTSSDQGQQGPLGGGDLDSEIPFGPEWRV